MNPRYYLYDTERYARPIYRSEYSRYDEFNVRRERSEDESFSDGAGWKFFLVFMALAVGFTVIAVSSIVDSGGVP